MLKGKQIPQNVTIIRNIIITIIIINIIAISITTTTLVLFSPPLLLAKYFGDGKRKRAPTLMRASARLLSASCVVLR